MFHSFARAVQSWAVVKGEHPLTENYSALGPEVMRYYDGSELASKDTKLLERLLEADAVLIAGQASSHCVRFTVDDLLSEIELRDPQLACKVYLLVDGMSPVTVPDGKGGFLADFTPQAEEALQRYAKAGMHLVRTSDSPETWPQWMYTP